MTALTDDQLLTFREQAGDIGNPPDVIDTQIQADYDKATLQGEDSDTTDAITMVYYIRRLIGLARKKIDVRGEVESESRSQLIKNLMDVMLPYWEGLAGMAGAGVMSTAELTLNLNYSEEDITNTWP